MTKILTVFLVLSSLSVMAQPMTNARGKAGGSAVASCGDVQLCADNGEIFNAVAANFVSATIITASSVAGDTTVTANTNGRFAIVGNSSAAGACAIDGNATATTGSSDGVRGTTAANNPTSHGVIGVGTGVAVGVQGTSGTGVGVYGTSSSGIGVRGETLGTTDGVYGSTSAGTSSAGARGVSTALGGNGVIGQAMNGSSAYGVFGISSTSGQAGHFLGNVQIIGNLSKSSGTFKIDHPLDPENKYLNHSFVESPDMKNIYDGVVTLDASGEAWITLPNWFGALNRDFRYQLTSIGSFQPVYVAEEISDNQFKIAGGHANGRVSWQVTGIRQDAYAEKNRIQVEEWKAVDERGYYLHPEAFGQPETKQIDAKKKGILTSNQ